MTKVTQIILGGALSTTLFISPIGKADETRNDCHKDGDTTYCVFVDTSKTLKTITVNTNGGRRQGPTSIIYSGRSLKSGDYLQNDEGYNIQTRIKYIDSSKIVIDNGEGTHAFTYYR